MLLPSSIPVNRQLLYGSGPTERGRMLIKAIASLPLSKVAEFVRHGWRHNMNILVMDGDERGVIMLALADPGRPPVINHNYLMAEQDRSRLREGVRLTVELLNSEPVRTVGVGAISVRPDVLASDKRLDDFIRRYVASANHLSGTCRMGPASDEMAVVDQRCRVHGVEHLRVVDTSIMPTVVRRGPNATAMMLGERAAAFFD